jgi:uridine kinase
MCDMKKPIVISISGVSGGGKTTVANALKEHLINAVIVSFDDYDDIKLDRDINDWSADANDENEWYVEPLAKDIARLLCEPFDYIIVDYPFGYRNLCVGQYINFAVFVDTPLDVALARRKGCTLNAVMSLTVPAFGTAPLPQSLTAWLKTAMI